MKLLFLILITLLLLGCQKESDSSPRKKGFKRSGEAVYVQQGFLCTLDTHDGPRGKVFIDALDFDQPQSLVRFMAVNDERVILDSRIDLGTIVTSDATFNTSLVPEFSLDSDPLVLIPWESNITSSELVVRVFLKVDGLVQFILNNVEQAEGREHHSSTVVASTSACKAARLDHENNRVVLN